MVRKLFVTYVNKILFLLIRFNSVQNFKITESQLNFAMVCERYLKQTVNECKYLVTMNTFKRIMFYRFLIQLSYTI